MKSALKYFCLFWLCLFIAGCDEPGEENVYVIDAPLTGLGLSPEKKVISTDRQQRVIFSDGFSVSVPENAFVDGEGKPVQGAVELSLKKYTSVASILASGIPMHYQGEDGEGMFQSAGMFEITASAGGTELALGEGKSLDVIFPTMVKGDYDFFQFVESESKRGTWVRKGVSPQKAYIELPETDKDFKLQWNIDKFPALTPFDTVSWKLATSERDPTAPENQWVMETSWDAFRISEPTHGLKDPVVSVAMNPRIDRYVGMHLHKDNGSTAFSTDKSVLFYDSTGRLVNEFKPEHNGEEVFSFWTGPRFVSVATSRGGYLLNESGIQVAFFEDEYIRDVHQDGNRILTLLDDFDDTFYLNDLKGEVLEIIKTRNTRYRVNGSFYNHLFFTDDYLIHMEEDAVEVLNLDGKHLHTVAGPFLDVQFLRGNQLLLIRSQQVSVLDVGTRAEIHTQVNTIDFQDTIFYDTDPLVTRKAVTTTIPGYNSILLTSIASEHDNSSIWHWDKNQLEQLSFRKVAVWNDDQRLVLGLNYRDSLLCVYDSKLKKQIYTETINDLSWVEAKREFGGTFFPVFDMVPSNALWMNEKSGRVFLNVGDQIKLLTLTGELVFDFYKYDSLISNAGVLDNEWIGTYSSDGVYELWNLNGEKMQSSLVMSDFESRMSFLSGPLTSSSEIPPLTLVYDFSGNLEVDLGSSYMESVPQSALKVLSDEKNEHLAELFRLPEGALQLTLIKGDKEFITYIYLTEGVSDLVSAYRGKYLGQLNEERKRFEEEKRFRRRYNISSMGLYNCDIVLRVPEALIFAANFRIDGEALPEEARIFDLMESEGYVVGEITDIDWEKYPIDPNLRHRFVVILPDNQLALFDFNDFEKIDWEKVRQEGTYTFNTKKIEGSFEKSEDLERLFSPQSPKQELN